MSLHDDDLHKPFGKAEAFHSDVSIDCSSFFISSYILRPKHISSCGMMLTALCQVLVPGPLVDFLALIAGLPAPLAAPALPVRLQSAKALAPALRKLRVRQQLLRERLLALPARHAACMGMPAHCQSCIPPLQSSAEHLAKVTCAVPCVWDKRDNLTASSPCSNSCLRSPRAVLSSQTSMHGDLGMPEPPSS